MAKKRTIEFSASPTGVFGLAYNPGDRADIEEKQASELIRAGYAFPIGKDGKAEKDDTVNSDLQAALDAEKTKSAALQVELDEEKTKSASLQTELDALKSTANPLADLAVKEPAKTPETPAKP